MSDAAAAERGGGGACCSSHDHHARAVHFSAANGSSGGRPCALVWSPIPLITWLMPFIGHMGVCSSSGRTYDFAGPFTVNEDHLLFGRPTRYLVLSPGRPRAAAKPAQGHGRGEHDAEAGAAGPAAHWGGPPGAAAAAEDGAGAAQWDNQLGLAAAMYRCMMYNIMTHNCHCFVAHFLNRIGYRGGGWNMVSLAALLFLRGRYTSLGGALYTWLPWAVLVALGGYFGRLVFLYVYLGVCLPLLTWFLLYTYCCWRDLSP